MLAFLKTPRGWLVVALVLIVGGWALSSAGARHGSSKVLNATVQRHADRVATNVQAVHRFDSSFYTLVGQRLEADRHLTISQHQYDSLRRLFPAVVPVLPAQPARYRPSR